MSPTCEIIYYLRKSDSDAAYGPEIPYYIGNLIMLSTKNRRWEYKSKYEKQMAKFFPRWDGPFNVTEVHTESSSYTLDIPSHAYPVFHASQLKPHHVNDPVLFPTCELTQPGLILTADGLKEYTINKILDVHHHGCRWQFLV